MSEKVFVVEGPNDSLVEIRDESGKGVIYTDSVAIGNASGDGVKIGDATSNDFGWRDIIGTVLTRGIGATDPDWAQVSSGPFYAYKFSLNDTCWMAYHVPHDIVPGSDFHLHVHWLPSGTDANTVKWSFAYTFAKGFDQEAFDTDGTTVTAEEAGPGTAFQHMVTESAAITVAGLTEPDGIIYVNITRVTNGGTDNTDDIFVLTADLHYQSTSMASSGKAPSFYG
jgi:hypothetical protein